MAFLKPELAPGILARQIKYSMVRKIGPLCLLILLPSLKGRAQITEVISLIKKAITKVINAVDLEVQRLQTQTIWLQDAQKELENTMSQLKLSEITDWVQKQKDLYAEYYQELSEVKQIIRDYDKAREIVQLQEKIVSLYQSAFAALKKNPNFQPGEIDYMGLVYTGILSQSLENAGQALLAVNSLVTQMSDGARLEILDNTARSMRKLYSDLQAFNSEAVRLSLQRAAEKNDVQTHKNYLGIP
jgi:hypothetical protein